MEGAGNMAPQVTSARLGRLRNTYLGAVDGVLRAAGWWAEDPAILAGLTGMAFHFCIERTLHHSAITVYANDNDWVEMHQDALSRIGIRSAIGHARPETGEGYGAERRRGISAIKSALDRGVGVVLWGVDYDEFGVVYGYDDGDGVFLVDGVESNPAGSSNPVLYENLGRHGQALPWLHYQIPVAVEPVDRAQAYRRSLEFYLEQMDRQADVGTSPWRHFHGLPGYDAWATALRSRKFHAFGLRYCTQVFAESKRFAASYMRHLVDVWEPELTDAASLFDRLAGTYDRMLGVLEQPVETGQWMWREPVSEAQAARLAQLVDEAHRLESAAVRAVASYVAGTAGPEQ